MPNCVITDVGFLTEIDSVSIIDAHNIRELVGVVDEKIRHGNLQVADSIRYEKRNVMLKAAKQRSWKALEEKSILWGIGQNKNGLYELITWKRGKPRGWVPDIEKTLLLDQQHVAADAVEQIIAQLQRRQSPLSLRRPYSMAVIDGIELTLATTIYRRL